MLWGEDSLPYSIYYDTRGEAFSDRISIIAISDF
jgi:hypothetical protein